jgi:predicted MFS family arabinose efflux permease
MSVAAKITLLFVVFVDLLGQGLVFPIINGLIMEPGSGFLPEQVSGSARHVDYGLVMGMFFLAWFLGVAYMARISDAIGRKNTLLICFFGALVGYVLTIISLYIDSLWLLIFGRAVTGFTAGNQPVAQAAMIDGSVDDADRDRNMGYIVTGISFGLVGGPIIGGILADKSLLGSVAGYKAPFYGALIIVIVAIVMVQVFFKDVSAERKPFVFRPLEVFEVLWRVTKYPLVLRLMPVYVFFMIANFSFYIFMDNYLTSAFGYGVIGSSVAMGVIGIALACSSTFLVVPTQERFDKQQIIGFTLVIWAICAIAFIASPNAVLCFVPLFVFYCCFGVAYPTILGIFSASVSAAEQGWVMGITTAVFTLVGGVMSLTGGEMMSVDIRLPFYVVIAAALLGAVSIVVTWNTPEIRRRTQMLVRPAGSTASD